MRDFLSANANRLQRLDFQIQLAMDSWEPKDDWLVVIMNRLVSLASVVVNKVTFTLTLRRQTPTFAKNLFPSLAIIRLFKKFASFGKNSWTANQWGTFAHLMQQIPTRAGGGGVCTLPPPPPQVHFLKCLKNALSYELETFWQFQWINFQNNKFFFNRLRPPLLTIATSKWFLKNTFQHFSWKAYQNSTFSLLFPWRVSQM